MPRKPYRSRGRSLALYGVKGISRRNADWLRAFIKYHQETGIWNAAEAARRVHFSEKNAKIEGSKILARPEVHSAWVGYLERLNASAEIDPIQQEIEHQRDVYALAHFQLPEVVEYDGDERALRIKPTTEWGPNARRAIKSIEQKEVVKVYDKDGFTETTRSTRIEAHDKIGALKIEGQELGRIHGARVRLPGGQEIETDADGGAVTVYTVNHFHIPDNGRGPKPVVQASTG